MNHQEAEKRIQKLKKVINYHRYLYHVLDKEEISSAALDSLKHELKELEEEYPDLITPDSPTQRVSGKPLNKFTKVTHKKRMLSLEDAFSQEELEKWEERIQKLIPLSRLIFFAEYKIDGFAISLQYKDSVLIQGATRGNGKIGENVTQNVKTIPAIPLKLELHKQLNDKVLEEKINSLLKKGEIEVRGEIYMPISSFEKINQKREKQGLPLYANPRNIAAGSVRQLDSKLVAERGLKFLAYTLPTNLGQKTHQQEHQILKALGFKTSEDEYCKNIREIFDFYKQVQQKREKLDYLIDGLVITVNSNRDFDKLGVVGKAPRGSIALKFPAYETTTVVLDIIIQVGRTGALTPVACLKPVNIGGVMVTRATLHNEDEIKKLDVKIGDTVIVQRAGDVIPDVVRVMKELRTGKEKKFIMPKKCPVCGKEVIRPKGEAVHRCTNSRCGAQQKKRIIHFVSKVAFNIDGLGPQIIDQLMDQGLINDPSDLYRLKRGDLVPLERFADKSADNLIKSIEESRKITLSRFIYALGIRHVGEETAIALANKFGTIEKIRKAGAEELLRVEDIGGVVAQSIHQWFDNKENNEYLEKLLKNIEIEEHKSSNKVNKLKDKTFVLTGELESMTRDDAKSKVRELGGDISSSVSIKTDFVVAGKNPGSKYDKAKKLKVRIIDESEFLKIVK